MTDKEEPKIIKVEPMDPTKKNSLITEKGAMCYWNGTTYSEGAQVCSGGRRLMCAYGTWSSVGVC